MKKQTLTIAAMLLVFATAGLLSSCSKWYGDPVTMNYSINGDYTKLDISSAFDVTVSDDVAEAVVTLPEDLHRKLKLTVKDGTLEIGYKSWINVASNVKATVVLPRNTQLRDLEVSGASSFVGDLYGTSSDIEVSGASKFNGSVVASSVDFDISGASDVSCFVDADEVELDLSGSSDANFEGTCTGNMDMDVSGSSRLKASALNTDAVTGELSGSSDADVTVCSRIAVAVSGASDLTYGTSSPDCHPTYGCTTSGSSSVTPR